MAYWPKQTIVEVADGIVAVLNGDGEIGVSNAACIIEQKRAFVVDTMTFPEMAEGMAREIARRGAHADMVLNTHHHIDHIGGNKVFADARIVGHPSTIGYLQQLGLPVSLYDTLMQQFRGRFQNIELVIPEPAIDQLTLPRGGELHVFTPAHTLADLTVWFPEARVLLAGDVSFIGVTPLGVHGLISSWIEALDTLLALKPAVVVPGHGPIGSSQDLLRQRDYLSAIYHLGQRAVKEGVSPEEALASFDTSPFADWLEADRTPLNLERAMKEVRGEIHRDNVITSLPHLEDR